MKTLLLSAMVGAFVLCNVSTSSAQEEITVLAPRNMRTEIDQIISQFQGKSRRTVKTTFVSGQAINQEIARGDVFDVYLVFTPDKDVLASGYVIASSATPIASVSVAVAVRQAAPKPDIATPEAVKGTLLAAKVVAYPDPTSGAIAGSSFEETLKKLGIEEEMQSKLRRARGGAGTMEMVAKGEADIGIAFLNEMTGSGIDIVGPLPGQISPPTTLVGFVSSHAKEPAIAQELLRYLTSPEVAGVFKAQGMQPGR
jgi:molybdate transport system substrate-binding protein